MQLFQQIGNASRAIAALGLAMFATSRGGADPRHLPARLRRRLPKPRSKRPRRNLYNPVVVKPAQPVEDPTFEIFRKQLADIVKRKDRAALQKLVVSQGFFWEGETGDKALKRKSSFENFATAIGLNDPAWHRLGNHRRSSGRPDT